MITVRSSGNEKSSRGLEAFRAMNTKIALRHGAIPGALVRTICIRETK